MIKEKNFNIKKRIIKYSAFSLMEMIVVLIIMGVIVSTTLPLFDGKAVKNKAAERFASEINNLIAAEQNYYMKNKDANGINIYSDNLDDLVNQHYIYKKPSNPFYNEEVQYNKYDINGVKGFSLKFNVPKDTVGKFFNLIPNLKKISENGNKITLQTNINIPGLEIGLSNLMHRDSGVNQELRTSHGPIQITDNVTPSNSYLLITDDNTQTPEQIKQNINNNNKKIFSDNKGGIRMGFIDNSNKLGIYGAGSGKKLYINSNINSEGGTLILGADEAETSSSSKVKIGIGKTQILEVYRKTISGVPNATNGYYEDGVYVYNNSPLNSNNPKKTATIKHNITGTVNENSLTLEDPTNDKNIKLKLASKKDTSNVKNSYPYIEFKNGANNVKTEVMDYSNTRMPISFIGSTGGIYTLSATSKTKINGKYIGKDCAGGKGEWRYKILGIMDWEVPNKYNLNYNTRTKTVSRIDLFHVYNRINSCCGGQFDVLYEVVPKLQVRSASYITDTPPTILGIIAYLTKKGNDYTPHCAMKLVHSKNGIQYVTLERDNFTCIFRVALMCLPKKDYNSNYN